MFVANLRKVKVVSRYKAFNLFIKAVWIVTLNLRCWLIVINEVKCYHPLWSVTLSPVIFISTITSIIFSSPGKIPINSIDSQARCWRLTIYKVAVSVACVLPFQYQRTNTTCEENKDAWYYFFKCWIISSAGSLLVSEMFILWKIYCSYPLTTTHSA